MTTLTTAAVADACVRLDLPLRLAPRGIQPLIPGRPLSGRARTVRHFGSVDVFFEAFESSAPGDVLVIDNEGRLDEGCIGDLTILEAQLAGIAGVIVWGLHRDTMELRRIGMQVFSCGCVPKGPLGARPREGDPFSSAKVGDLEVLPGEMVVADDDGVVFVRAADWIDVARAAEKIAKTERTQALRAKNGETLRQQFAFSDYLARRSADPTLTFRAHLRGRGGAVEE